MKWQKIYNEKEEIKIFDKITEIADLLIDNNLNEISFFGGRAGIVLFKVYCSRFFLIERYYESAIDDIQIIFDDLNKSNPYYSYSSGLAGIGWLMEFLQQNNLLNCDTNDIIGDIDHYLYISMISELNKGNYDYLHSAGGIALYFLKRMKKLPKAKEYLYEFIDVLDEIKYSRRK